MAVDVNNAMRYRLFVSNLQRVLLPVYLGMVRAVANALELDSSKTLTVAVLHNVLLPITMQPKTVQQEALGPASNQSTCVIIAAVTLVSGATYKPVRQKNLAEA